MGLRYARGTREYIATLAPGPKQAVKACLRALEGDPRPSTYDVRLLAKGGPHRFYRVRLGDYRIVYSPGPSATFVWRIFHRSEGYDWLDTFDPPDGP